ncbi:hypothetical protein Q3G72_004644 [Acer saccharum]|nr:hypothetical protein Q3G72_004644 [Acer saccharum]
MKKVLGVYAMENHFWYRVTRSTTTRYEASCADLNCQWLVHVVKKCQATHWYVNVYRDTHTCKVQNYGLHFNQHGVHLLYNKANQARLHALKIQYGDPLKSFQTLPAYFYMLKQANPGTLTNIETDSKDRFKYGFMAIGVCLQGFSRVIRPVVSIDATHLTGSVKGVLLIASAKDGDSKIYPLAFGFAASECKGSWTWFLSELKKGIGFPQDLVIVSDRHRGALYQR